MGCIIIIILFLVYNGFLEKEHIECWHNFVLACRLLCKRAISVTLADFLKIFQRVECIYGKDVITPNLHMHLHRFWLFSYERYNILEHQPTNNRSIEIQLMSRFLRDSNHTVFSLLWNTEMCWRI